MVLRYLDVDTIWSSCSERRHYTYEGSDCNRAARYCNRAARCCNRAARCCNVRLAAVTMRLAAVTVRLAAVTVRLAAVTMRLAAVQVPSIVMSLQRSVQAILLGRRSLPHWLSEGVKDTALMHTTQLALDPEGQSIDIETWLCFVNY